MIRVGIVGATGYTGLELLKLLLPHPQVEIVAVTSRQAGAAIGAVHPRLAGRLDLVLENLTPSELADRCDCVFCCLPHGASAETVAALLAAGTRVVDFSADYRLNSVPLYEKWYATDHPDPQRVGTTPYGLPEWFKSQISGAPLVANPGCYPTSAILALAPLLKSGVVSPNDLIIDSKSGVTGAGRTPKLATHYPECNESFAAYSVGNHRHTPEIELLLSTLSGSKVDLIFTPHLVPMDRGILTTAYAQRAGSQTQDQLLGILKEAYADHPFVRVSEDLPATKHTAYTNYCDLSLRLVGDRVVVVSCIDNLIKGASGAAVQNMNVMFDLSETMGLL